MAAESTDSASNFRLATRIIIEEFCASPSATATLVLRMKNGIVDLSSLDPISRLAVSELRLLYGELEKTVRNCAQESESSTSDIGGNIINCLQHDGVANQKDTLNHLARLFLDRKRVQAQNNPNRDSQSNDDREKNIKFVRTRSKSPAEVLNFMSRNDSSVEHAPQRPLQLPTLRLQQTSDSEQSSIASGSSKSTKSSKRSGKSAASDRSRPVSSSRSSSSRGSTDRESYASTSSTHTSYNSGDIRMVDDSTVQLDMVARQVTAHLLQNEQFVEQLKVLQAAGLPLKSPDVLMLGQTPLFEKIQAIAQAGVSAPVLLTEPTIASEPWTLDEMPPDGSHLHLTSAAARANDKASSSQTNSPLPELNTATQAKRNDVTSATDVQTDNFPERNSTVPVDTNFDNQETYKDAQEGTQGSSSISQDISSSTTNQSLSDGQIPFKTLARVAPNLNIITVRPDGSIVGNQPNNVGGSQSVQSVKTRKPKVSEWLQGQTEHFTMPVLDLTSESTTADHTNRDRAPIEVVSALRKRNDADDEDSNTTLDQVTEMSA